MREFLGGLIVGGILGFGLSKLAASQNPKNAIINRIMSLGQRYPDFNLTPEFLIGLDMGYLNQLEQDLLSGYWQPGT